MMDLRHLNYFLVLAEELHYGRAAKRLNISQPPLTRMIQQIEGDLGVALFERTRRSVMLTAAGKELLADAKQIVLQTQTVKKRLSAFGKGETGVIKIGYVGAVMHTEIPTLLATFSNSYPQIHLQFEEQPNAGLLHGLYSGTMDIAFVRTWLSTHNLCEDVISREPLVAVLPNAHPLARKQTLDARELKEEPFITFTRECGPTLFDAFLSLCSKAGFTPNILHHASQLNSVLRLVESGFGISILPYSTAAAYRLKLKFIPIANTKESIPLILLSRAGNPSLAVSHLKRYILNK